MAKRKMKKRKCSHEILEQLGNQYYKCMNWECGIIIDKNTIKYGPHIKNRPWEEGEPSIATILSSLGD